MDYEVFVIEGLDEENIISDFDGDYYDADTIADIINDNWNRMLPIAMEDDDMGAAHWMLMEIAIGCAQDLHYILDDVECSTFHWEPEDSLCAKIEYHSFCEATGSTLTTKQWQDICDLSAETDFYSHARCKIYDCISSAMHRAYDQAGLIPEEEDQS